MTGVVQSQIKTYYRMARGHHPDAECVGDQYDYILHTRMIQSYQYDYMLESAV